MQAIHHTSSTIYLISLSVNAARRSLDHGNVVFDNIRTLRSFVHALDVPIQAVVGFKAPVTGRK